jgi:predicted transcriptional regulator
MDALWSTSPQTPLAATDIAARIKGDRDWSSRTVKTLLSRLVEKGALATQQDGRRFLYSPIISRADYERSAARSLADRLFGGRAAPLVAHLADGEGLSPADIAELEAIIKALKS